MNIQESCWRRVGLVLIFLCWVLPNHVLFKFSDVLRLKCMIPKPHKHCPKWPKRKCEVVWDLCDLCFYLIENSISDQETLIRICTKITFLRESWNKFCLSFPAGGVRHKCPLTARWQILFSLLYIKNIIW